MQAPRRRSSYRADAPLRGTAHKSSGRQGACIGAEWIEVAGFATVSILSTDDNWREMEHENQILAGTSVASLSDKVCFKPQGRSTVQSTLRGLLRGNMQIFAFFLRLSAPVFLIVGAIHLVLGVGADVLLGAKLTAEAVTDPGLDSQNRFYGVSFALYGVLFLVCASNIPKYAIVLRCVLWVFFAAGVARLVSIAIHGMPPALVVALLVSELVLPPVLAWWLSRVTRET